MAPELQPQPRFSDRQKATIYRFAKTLAGFSAALLTAGVAGAGQAVLDVLKTNPNAGASLVVYTAGTAFLSAVILAAEKFLTWDTSAQ